MTTNFIPEGYFHCMQNFGLIVLFITWKILCHFLLTFLVSDEKSTLIQIVIALCIMCHLSVTAFQTFPFSSVFRNLTISFQVYFFVYLVLDLFGFLNLWISIFCQMWKVFSPSGIPMTQKLGLLLLSNRSLGLC